MHCVDTSFRTESCFILNKLTKIIIKSGGDAGKNQRLSEGKVKMGVSCPLMFVIQLFLSNDFIALSCHRQRDQLYFCKKYQILYNDMFQGATNKEMNQIL